MRFRLTRHKRLAPAAVLFLACLLLAFHPACGEEIYAAYRVSYAGLPAGEIRFSFTGDGGDYRDRIAVESAGLPRWITHFRGMAVSEGRFAGDGRAAPLSYDVLYDLRKRHDRRINLRFVSRGGDVIAERGETDTSSKPPIAEPYRRNAVDPVSAMATIRRELRIHRLDPARDFTVPVYDGTRRFDVLVHVVPAVENGEKDGLIHLHLTLEPIAGFWEQSSEDAGPSSDPRPVEAAFTDDDKLLPVYMRVSVWYLPMVVKFDRLCKSFDSCGQDGG